MVWVKNYKIKYLDIVYIIWVQEIARLSRSG